MYVSDLLQSSNLVWLGDNLKYYLPVSLRSLACIPSTKSPSVSLEKKKSLLSLSERFLCYNISSLGHTNPSCLCWARAPYAHSASVPSFLSGSSSSTLLPNTLPTLALLFSNTLVGFDRAWSDAMQLAALRPPWLGEKLVQNS